MTDWRTGLNYTVEGGTGTTFRTTAYAYSEISTAQSIFSAGNTVTDARTGGTVYTGKISASNVSGQYFAAGDDTGSRELWLEIAGGTHTGVVAAGAAAGGTVGVGKVKVSGGTTNLLLGGGNTGAVQSGAAVEVAGGTVKNLYGGGKQGGYAAGIDVSVSGASTEVGSIYAGVLLNKIAGNFAVDGEINLTVDSGSVTGFVFGAGKVNAGSVAETVAFNNDINLTVAGGSFNSGVYGLGYAASLTGGTVLTMAPTKKVDLEISGGTFATNVYLGALADGAVVSGAALTAEVSGGTINGALVGGGLAQNNGQSNAGAVSITVTGGEIASIIGGGSHVNLDDNRTTVASVAISVSGGSIGSIYAGGHYNGTKAGYCGADTVTGNAELTLSGDAEVGVAAGSWRGIDTVGGQRKLVFDDFAGSCGAVCDWDLVSFDGENASTVDLSSSPVYGVGEWSFDVIGRQSAASTALVNLVDGFGAASTIDLRITDAAASLTTWSLAGVSASQSFEGTSFKLFLDDATSAAATVSLGQAIGSGTFATYGFTVADNTLKFAQLSA